MASVISFATKKKRISKSNGWLFHAKRTWLGQHNVRARGLVCAQFLDKSFRSKSTQTVKEMISFKIKVAALSLVAAVAVATLAVARAKHTHPMPASHAASERAPAASPPGGGGVLVCSERIAVSQCDELRSMMPIGLIRAGAPGQFSVKI